MIKIGIRKNLIYPLMVIILYFIRTLDEKLLILCGFSGSLLYSQLMFLGELISGLIIYQFNINFMKIGTKRRKSTYMKIELIQNQALHNIPHPDNTFKIYFLFFMSSFFDCYEFILATIYLPIKNKHFSKSLKVRLNPTRAIEAALLCCGLFNYPFYRHQLCSLIIILILVIFIILSEYHFLFLKHNSGNALNLTLSHFLIILQEFFFTMMDVIDKYLMEYNFINPFQLLLFEGFFGLILSLLYSFKENPIEPFDNVENTTKLALVIIGLIVYCILSGLCNSYRIITNKIYSPIHLTLAYCILDPIWIIYHFIVDGDFVINGKRYYYFFIINLIISIAIIFCICVFNEVLIFFLCGLEYNTHLQITERANSEEIFSFGLDSQNEIN